MTKRTSSAKWVESKGYWMIKVQQDGMRKIFYSTKPGRNGQREANAKADAWLEFGTQGRSIRCKQAVEEFLELKQEIVGHSKSMDTFDVYGHLVNGQLEDTAKRIDQIFLDVLHFTPILRRSN